MSVNLGKLGKMKSFTVELNQYCVAETLVAEVKIMGPYQIKQYKLFIKTVLVLVCGNISSESAVKLTNSNATCHQ